MTIYDPKQHLKFFNVTVKFRKQAPGLIFFKGPFGGAYVRKEICVSKSIGLACTGKEIYHFCFVLLCIRGQIPSTSPRGAYIRRGRLNGGFFALRFWGAYLWRSSYMEELIFEILRYIKWIKF